MFVRVCVCVCVRMHVVALCCLHMHSGVGVGTTAYKYEFSFAQSVPHITTPSTPILMFLHTYINNISRTDCTADNIQSLCACVCERKIK